jgi:citrate synthase
VVVIAERGSSRRSQYGRGLEGLIAGETAISEIDGVGGALRYRGCDIDALAAEVSFDRVAHFLLFGELPGTEMTAAWREELASWRDLPPAGLTAITNAAPTDDLFAVFESAVAATALDAPALDRHDEASRRAHAARLLSWTAGLAAAAIRRSQDAEPVPARADLRYAEHFLWSIRGEEPTSEQIRAFEVSLVVQAEHGLHAAALAALVTWSGGADLDASVLAGIGALGGSLHGGANRPAYESLRTFDTPDAARAWARARIAERFRFPGYGHRVYKCPDPRARILASHARRLLEREGRGKLWAVYQALSEEIEAALGPKGIYANIDAMTGLVYAPLGLPLDAFTIPFCLAIQTGWMAHCFEYDHGRLVQPHTLEIRG